MPVGSPAMAGGEASIGRLRRVPLREVWAHEALDFTPWLELNPDALGEVLDSTVDNIERERAAGDFSSRRTRSTDASSRERDARR